MSELWNKVKMGSKEYINLYNPLKAVKKERTETAEGFQNNYNVDVLGAIRSIIYLILLAVACYMSYCYHGRLLSLDLIVAIICPPVYIIILILINGGDFTKFFPCSFPPLKVVRADATS
jgi:hypothetical protein